MFDSVLLELIKTDKNKGLLHLIDQYTPLVYTVVKSKISSVCTEEDIEETVSDVFNAFYNQADSVDLTRGSIAAYLVTIAKRKAVDVYRKASKNHEVALLNDENELIELPDSFNLEDEVQKKELRKILLSVINSLGEPDSAIIIRRFYLGENSKDIALVTGLSEDNVRKRLSRALRKIEKELKGENYEV